MSKLPPLLIPRDFTELDSLHGAYRLLKKLSEKMELDAYEFWIRSPSRAFKPRHGGQSAKPKKTCSQMGNYIPTISFVYVGGPGTTHAPPSSEDVIKMEI